MKKKSEIRREKLAALSPGKRKAYIKEQEELRAAYEKERAACIKENVREFERIKPYAIRLGMTADDIDCMERAARLESDDRDAFGRQCRHMKERAKELRALLDEKISKESNDLLSIQEAADYARVDERTIRKWAKQMDGDKPMLPEVIEAGSIIRIPRKSLTPYRKAKKDTRAQGKRPVRKPVKQ